MFTTDVQPLFDLAESFDNGYEWGIVGFPVWDGTVDGRFEAKDAKTLLRAITVDSEWILRYEVKDGTLFASLSHHDAPTGGAMTVKPLPNMFTVVSFEEGE